MDQISEKNYVQKLERINCIIKNYEFASGFEVLFNKKKKILIGGSFDSIYYYLFFILFTGVEKTEEANLPEEDEHLGSPVLTDAAAEVIIFPGRSDKATKLTTSYNEYLLFHRNIGYYFPKDPIYTGVGLPKESDAKLINYTFIVDQCMNLVDDYTNDVSV